MNGAPAAPAAAAAGGGTAAAAAVAAVPVPQPAVPPKILNLVIPHIDGRLLLGRKLRGFGEGYVNGFGGKVEVGETIEASARREVRRLTGRLCAAAGRLAVPQQWQLHALHAVIGAPIQSGTLLRGSCSWPPKLPSQSTPLACPPAHPPARPAASLQLLEEAGIVATDMQHRGIYALQQRWCWLSSPPQLLC